jgi:GH15 family glucan-1,4-alpha-glucosidase
VGALALTGRLDDARALYERLLGLTNDLGLLAEEYDVERRRQVGNFPQAFSHLGIINAARVIGVAEQARADGRQPVLPGQAVGARGDLTGDVAG